MNISQALLDNAHLITMKPYQFHNETLYVVKYKRKVFYNNLWNPELEQFRGLVLDSNHNIVQYPFTKIYNYAVEENAPSFDPDELVLAFNKINGFMVAITSHNGNLLVTTTGSIEGPFSQLAREYITPKLEQMIHDQPQFTFLFECCHPSDPHIIVEQEGLYYLGARLKQPNSLVDPRDYPFDDECYYPMRVKKPFAEVQQKALNRKLEGVVVYSLDLQRATKIKSKYYLMSKALARASTDKLSRLRIDEEFRELSILSRTPEFMALDEQGRLQFIRSFYSN